MKKVREFTTTKAPVALIYGVNSVLARPIIDIFLEEGTKIIAVDKVNSQTKGLLKDLASNPNFLFIDVTKLIDLKNNFIKIDYILSFWDHIISGSSYPKFYKSKFSYVELTYKDFLFQTQIVDTLLKTSIEFAAKTAFILPGYLGQIIHKHGQYNLELLEHIQRLFQDHYARTKFFGKLTFVPEPIGKPHDYALGSVINYTFRQLVSNNVVKVPGQGLAPLNVGNVKDLTRAILFATFSTKGNGQPILLFEKDTTTLLKLLYTALEVTKNDINIEFVDLMPGLAENLANKDKWIPVNSLEAKDIGIEPAKLTQDAVYQQLQQLNDLLKGAWQPLAKAPQSQTAPEIATTKSSPDTLPALASKYKQATNPVSRIFWLGVWKIFDIFIKKPVDFLTDLLTGNLWKKTSWWRMLLSIFALGIILLLSIILSPLVGLGVNLVFNKPENIDKINKYIYQLSYLRYTPLEKDYLATQEYVSALNNVYSTATQAQKQIEPVIQFLSKPSRNPELLQQIQANPTLVNVLLTKLKLETEYLEQLSNRSNFILQTLRPSAQRILEQAKATLATLETLDPVYPYIPALAGYPNMHNIAIIFVDAQSPTHIGGVPFGIATLSFDKGEPVNINYVQLPQASQNALAGIDFNSLRSRLAQVVKNQAAFEAHSILVINQDILRHLNIDATIPGFGQINRQNINKFIKNIRTIENLPYSFNPVAINLVNKMVYLDFADKTKAYSQVFNPEKPSAYFLQTTDKLLPLLDKFSVYVNPGSAQSLSILPLEKIVGTNTEKTGGLAGLTKNISVLKDLTAKKVTLKLAYIYKNNEIKPANVTTQFTTQSSILISNASNVTISSNVLGTIQTQGNLKTISYEVLLSPNQTKEVFVQIYVDNAQKLENLKIYNLYPFQKIQVQ